MGTTVRHYRTGQPWRVSFRDGAVERMEPCDEPALGSLILAPALFDIQVNGFAGVDFNSRALQAEDLLQATRALARYSVTRFLPTVVTGPLDRMRTILQVIVEATRRYTEVGQAVGGVHVEGPYISGLEGARGAHDPRWVRPPDEAEFSALQEAAAHPPAPSPSSGEGEHDVSPLPRTGRGVGGEGSSSRLDKDSPVR